MHCICVLEGYAESKGCFSGGLRHGLEVAAATAAAAAADVVGRRDRKAL